MSRRKQNWKETNEEKQARVQAMKMRRKITERREVENRNEEPARASTVSIQIRPRFFAGADNIKSPSCCLLNRRRRSSRSSPQSPVHLRHL
jgi:hypothetical protein